MKRVLPPIVALVLFLALWEGGVRALGIKEYLLPPPSAIAKALVGDSAALGRAFVTTATATLLGFGSSVVLGVGTGVVLASSRLVERAFYPYVILLQTVPIIAIAPMLNIWFGAGLRASTLCAIIVSVFPIIANTITGIRSVDPALRDLFKLYGASRLTTLVKLELPSALPNVFTGLRIAAGLSVIGTIVGEFVAGFNDEDAGLGIKILTANKQLRTDLSFAAVGIASALGLLMFVAVGALGSRLTRRWHASAK